MGKPKYRDSMQVEAFVAVSPPVDEPIAFSVGSGLIEFDQVLEV